MLLFGRAASATSASSSTRGSRRCSTAPGGPSSSRRSARGWTSGGSPGRTRRPARRTSTRCTTACAGCATCRRGLDEPQRALDLRVALLAHRLLRTLEKTPTSPARSSREISVHHGAAPRLRSPYWPKCRCPSWVQPALEHGRETHHVLVRHPLARATTACVRHRLASARAAHMAVLCADRHPASARALIEAGSHGTTARVHLRRPRLAVEPLRHALTGLGVQPAIASRSSCRSGSRRVSRTSRRTRWAPSPSRSAALRA
jgi:hypothetical protein